MGIVKVYSKNVRAASASMHHPFKVLVALLFLSKHKNLFCLDDTLNGMANNTQTTCGEKSKRVEFLWIIIRRVVNDGNIFIYSCRFEINGGKKRK
jgi:hypothetical protein